MLAAHEQMPSLQSGVGCAHGVPELCQVPALLQLSGCAPLQMGVLPGAQEPTPGTQIPEHAPLVHAPYPRARLGPSHHRWLHAMGGALRPASPLRALWGTRYAPNISN